MQVWRLIRCAVIFPADFWRTNFRQRIRQSVAAEGSICYLSTDIDVNMTSMREMSTRSASSQPGPHHALHYDSALHCGLLDFHVDLEVTARKNVAQSGKNYWVRLSSDSLTIARCDSMTEQIMDTSPAQFLAYGHHKNKHPAIHMTAVSIAIMQLLLYIV